jgi:1-phosphofructokinase family hexose kinase
MDGEVVTVSPNTSTDRISIIDGFVPGGTFRTVRSFDQAGGSGAHAASTVVELGGRALAIAAVGGGNGERWHRAARRQHLPAATVRIRNENRSSFVLIDRQQGKVAEIVDPGPTVDAHESDALLQMVRHHLASAALLVVSGSLPPGVPTRFYAQCVEHARAAGRSTLVDAHSAPMAAALAARPWMIKPNLDELHQIMSVTRSTMRDRMAALRHLVRTTVENVMLSMEAEGVLLATRDGIWHLQPPAQPVTLPESQAINPVGCGDALVGAFCHRWVTSRDLIESARWGVAAAHVNLGTYEVPSTPRDEVQRLAAHVAVHPLEISGGPGERLARIPDGE